MASEGSFFHTVRRDRFDIVFRLGDKDPDRTENIDAVVQGGGSRWYATFLTVSEVGRIMRRHEASGESLGGRYFVCTDLVIVREPGIQGMADAIVDLAETGDLETFLTRLDDEPD
jgi:hypothetical protein